MYGTLVDYNGRAIRPATAEELIKSVRSESGSFELADGRSVQVKRPHRLYHDALAVAKSIANEVVAHEGPFETVIERVMWSVNTGDPARDALVAEILVRRGVL